MSFRLEIVTPEGKAFSDEVKDVVLPGGLGEMDVLPSHSNFVTTLVPGELRFNKDGQSHEMAIGTGFAEIQGDQWCGPTGVSRATCRATSGPAGRARRP